MRQRKINLPWDAMPMMKKMRKVVETLKHLLLFMLFSLSRLFAFVFYRWSIIINSSKSLGNIFFFHCHSLHDDKVYIKNYFLTFLPKLMDANFFFSKNEMSKQSKLVESSKRAEQDDKEKKEKLMKFTSRHECLNYRK